MLFADVGNSRGSRDCLDMSVSVRADLTLT